ncbi:MAG: efflux RND transporter periplasmic adaptor subunit [Candidatus Zixiibacteriota bacterium]
MFKRIALVVVVLSVVSAVLFFAIDGSAKKDDENKTFAVKRGSIIDKALAVGRIEPKREIAIKSKIGGIVRRAYVEIGDKVKVGDPLFDIAPDPTPVEYTEAKRQVEIAQVSFDNTRLEYERTESLRDKQLISHQEYDNQRAKYEEEELRLRLAQEKLSLIQSGKATVADLDVNNVIKSPMAGIVLSRLVDEGDPVVPLTSFQAGTELMTIAQMDNLVFNGNVDEIDVGKLFEGMPAEVEIGAIPDEHMKGIVRKISPKAHREEGSTMFEVEVTLEQTSSSFLRAGYSANANVIITKKEDILLAPERLVKFDDSVATVEVQDSLGVITSRTIETGLSDGINIEIVSGLEEGELLVERPPREISAD